MKTLFGNRKRFASIAVTLLIILGTQVTSYADIAPVSERTPQVRDAIVAAVPEVNNAGDVTAAHLGAIAGLSLYRKGIHALKASDFDGLTALTTLYLGDNQLSSLPAGVFDDLTALTWLSLSFNQLSSLPAGLFGDLTALTGLGLSGNQLSSLPAGIFDDLTALTGLGLDDNQLSSLPAGIFDDLTALTGLGLGGNQLSSLPAGLFDDLTALTWLGLGGNQLSSLPAGLFDDLTALTWLSLSNNQLSSLPAGIFDGLTALTGLRLSGNSVNPLLLTVSLERVGTEQFKAAAPVGAPFDIVLPISVSNGSIAGGATSVTIPAGSVESELLTVARTSGTTLAVTVDIGTLPESPNSHSGYTLVKSADLPVEVLGATAAEQTTTDFNGDGTTDFVDFFLFVDAYGGTDAVFDLNGDGTVDFVDFFAFVDGFGPSAQPKLVAMAREMFDLPSGPQLYPNAPNPFNRETVLSWLLLRPGAVRLEVFALNGQRLVTLWQGPQQAGYHLLHWDGRDDGGRPLASGIYLYRLVTGEEVLTRKLTLLR